MIDQTAPVMRNAAIDRLVHLNPDLPGALLGRNGELRQMWSLEQSWCGTPSAGASRLLKNS